ncbi:transposase-like protein [Apiospora marii]|uniref:Transposase-like protein n=1 Tax=Apiospora marii TaxID=335849 RepID=A0ABR1S0Y5_9PEZI
MDFNWDPHLDEVRNLYIVERKSLKEIQQTFKQKYGCTASQKQWTQQLGRWKLKKNLSEKDWKYVSHVTRKRKAMHKDSLVFVSGVQVPPERIKTGWRNHSTKPRDPIRRGDLCVHPCLYSYYRGTELALAAISIKAQRLFSAFERIMHNFDFPYRDIACHMPDEAPDSHDERAYQIAHGQGLNSLHAVMEVLTFLLSNNMLSEKLNHDAETYDRCVIGIFEWYLMIGSSFNGIFFTEDRTFQAVLEEAFASIICSSRLDLLKTLVAFHPGVKKLFNRSIIREPGFHGASSPIELALNNGDIRTADFLSSHGATIDDTGINTIRYIETSRSSPYYSWRVHNTFETVDWILARCTKIRESKLLKILAWLDDGQRNETTAALVLDKLWQIEVSTDLRSPASALLYAIRFNNQEFIENIVPCGARLLQDEVPQGYDIALSTAKSWVHFMPLGEATYSLDKTMFPRLLEIVSRAQDPQTPKMLLGEALITAAAVGNLDAIELLLETTVDVNWWSNYFIGRRYGKPAIFEKETSQKKRTPLRAALAHRQTGAIKLLLQAGAEVQEDDIMEAIRQDIFDQFQDLLGFRIDMTSCSLLSLVQNDCLRFLSSIELVNLTWTENCGGAETALADAIVMGRTDLVDCLKEHGSLRYDPFALIAAVLAAQSLRDRSTIEYMLGLRETSLSNDHTSSYLELAAFFIAVSFQDIETLKMFEYSGLFETYQAHISGESHLYFDNIWGVRCLLAGWSRFFLDEAYYLNELHYQNGYHRVETILSTAEDAIGHGIASLLGLAVGIGANQATMGFLLQTLPKPSAIDVVIALMNSYESLNNFSGSSHIPIDPRRIHDLIDLAPDVKYWKHTEYPTLLQAAIEAGFDCVALRLLEIGSDVNALPPTLGQGRNALQAACNQGSLSLVQRLLEAGAEVNSPVTNDNNPTALQIAVMIGHIPLATLLLDSGADCNNTSCYEGTAIEFAAENGRIDMIELLLARGVQTTCTYRWQYFRAIQSASERAHHVAETILRDHRPWDQDDWKSFEETCICYAGTYRYMHGDSEFGVHQRTCPVSLRSFHEGGSKTNELEPPDSLYQGVGVNSITINSPLTVAPRERMEASIDLMEYELDSGSCGTNNSTPRPHLIDLDERLFSAEDSISGQRFSLGPPQRLPDGLLNEEAGNDDWPEDWVNFDPMDTST